MITTLLVLLMAVAFMALLIGAIWMVFTIIPAIWVACVICVPIVAFIALDIFIAVKIIKKIFSKT